MRRAARESGRTGALVHIARTRRARARIRRWHAHFACACPQLLATASSMAEEEQRARAVMEPRETPRGEGGAADGIGAAPATRASNVRDSYDGDLRA